MMATLGGQERLPWAHALTAIACTVHATVIVVYASVFFGLMNTELAWQGVEQMPRGYLGTFVAGVVAVHGTVALGPLLPRDVRRSPMVRAVRGFVAALSACSLVFAGLLLPFAAIDGAAPEGWALIVGLSASAAVLLVGFVRRGEQRRAEPGGARAR